MCNASNLQSDSTTKTLDFCALHNLKNARKLRHCRDSVKINTWKGFQNNCSTARHASLRHTKSHLSLPSSGKVSSQLPPNFKFAMTALAGFKFWAVHIAPLLNLHMKNKTGSDVRFKIIGICTGLPERISRIRSQLVLDSRGNYNTSSAHLWPRSPQLQRAHGQMTSSS